MDLRLISLSLSNCRIIIFLCVIIISVHEKVKVTFRYVIGPFVMYFNFKCNTSSVGSFFELMFLRILKF